MRILWLNPIGTGVFDEEILRLLSKSRRAGTEVHVVSLPGDRPKHLQYHAYEASVVADVTRLARLAADEYDALVIGCFYDTGLRDAREVSGRALVTAPCESATAIASTLGNRFSVLVSERKNIPRMSENVRLYGHAHRMASMRPLGIKVHEFQANRARTHERLIAEGRAAVEEDGAEVVVLGCTIEFGFHEVMQQELGVPVIDAVLAPFKYAELLVELRDRFGWCPSRVGGSSAPPPDEIATWDLFGQPPPIGQKLCSEQ